MIVPAPLAVSAALDFTAITEDPDVDLDDDFLLFYDASQLANNKVRPFDLFALMADRILTDANGDVISDADGNVLTA